MTEELSGASHEQSDYRTYLSPAGPVIGQYVRRRGGTSLLRIEDGTELPLAQGARVTPVANPERVPRIPFHHAEVESPEQRVAALVDELRRELANADQRRSWIAAWVTGLADDRLVDELIRFRYEEFRHGLQARLRESLAVMPREAGDRTVLQLLAQDNPGDIRRAAMLAALDRRQVSAVPLICGAAVHRTQKEFAREAVAVLTDLAPSRLPLIAPELDPEIRAGLGSDPVNGPLSDTTQSDDDCVHLLLAAPAEQQRSSLASSRAGRLPGVAERMLSDASARESLTSYELLVRRALGKLVLSAPEIFSPEARQTAAKLVLRDNEPDQLLALIEQLEEPSARLVLSAAVGNLRGRVARWILVEGAARGMTVDASSARQLSAALAQSELDGELRTAAMLLMLRNAETSSRAASVAVAEMGRTDANWSRALARALILSGERIDSSRLSRAAREHLLKNLEIAEAAAAARVLGGLGVPSDPEQAAREAGLLRLPQNAAADALLEDWLPSIAAAGKAAPCLERAASFIIREGAARWPSWSSEQQGAAVELVDAAFGESAASEYARLTAQLESGTKVRRVFLDSALQRVIARDPALITSICSSIPEAEVTLALLRIGARFQKIELERRRSLLERDDTDQSRSLAILIETIDDSAASLGDQSELGALMKRLQRVVRNHRDNQGVRRDPLISEYEANLRNAPTTDLLGRALRAGSARGGASPSTVAFFRDEAERLLRSLDADQLRAFVAENQRLLERVSAEATALVIVACVIAELPGTEWNWITEGAIGVAGSLDAAFRVVESHEEAALGLCRSGTNGLRQIAARVRAQALAVSENADSANSNPRISLVREMGPTLEALEAMALHVMRLRRVMASCGLSPVEPILGAIREFSELQKGEHRVIGLSSGAGRHEVRSLGVRDEATGVVVLPASVVRLSDESENSIGQMARAISPEESSR